MKVTAFVGSARKKHTYATTELMLEKLRAFGDVECEIVRLSDYSLGTCKGCILCMDNGEEFCPYKDDRDVLMDKMLNSDGVIFASPNYSFNVSGWMKIFLERIGFILHRPRFFGKTFTSIVAQGIYGGNTILKYLSFVAGGMGFNVVKGCCINSLEPMTEKGRAQIDKVIDRQSRKFHARMLKNKYPVPNLLELMVFRMSRTSRRIMLAETHRDYRYVRDNGWFESDYYYPVALNPLNKLAGKLFDVLAVQIVKTR